jgi:FkbM family methyltransferase
VLTVASVLRSGGIYDATWVARLKAAVAKHLPIEHRFVCLSDIEVPCERLVLVRNWPGWWAKVELGRLTGPVLYFDLDTAIVGDLSDIAERAMRAPFTMLRDFYTPKHCGSGVMAWADDAPRQIYNHAIQFGDRFMGVQRARMGDQAYIEETYKGPIDRWQDAVGDQIVSYKVHCRAGIPSDARVICLHGHPKFDEMSPADPVRIAWEASAPMDVAEGYTFKRGLLWPAEDDETRRVIHAMAGDIEIVYRHCKQFRVVVQAGGNCGVYPEILGKRFDLVYTFEPDAVNFRCLCANAPAENIYKFNAALGDKHECIDLQRNPKRVGAHHVDGRGDIPTFRIDDLALDVCDLIFLDVEGYERRVLLGAIETIDRCQPTIVVEDKASSERYGTAKGQTVEWLVEAFGYRVAERTSRDAILVP